MTKTLVSVDFGKPLEEMSLTDLETILRTISAATQPLKARAATLRLQAKITAHAVRDLANQLLAQIQYMGEENQDELKDKAALPKDYYQVTDIEANEAFMAVIRLVEEACKVSISLHQGSHTQTDYGGGSDTYSDARYDILLNCEPAALQELDFNALGRQIRLKVRQLNKS